jgi:hypothetical protein
MLHGAEFLFLLLCFAGTLLDQDCAKQAIPSIFQSSCCTQLEGWLVVAPSLRAGSL